jgi:hypothetical protein
VRVHSLRSSPKTDPSRASQVTQYLRVWISSAAKDSFKAFGKNPQARLRSHLGQSWEGSQA